MTRSNRKRSAAVVVVLVGIAVALAGCTVKSVGVTGISVDADGNWIVRLAWCGDNPPDGATVYISDKDVVGVYHAPDLTGTHSASFRVDSPADGWTVVEQPRAIVSGPGYSAFGWTTDNTASTNHVDFHFEDRNRLKPGEVFYQWTGKGGNWADTVASIDEFNKSADRMC